MYTYIPFLVMLISSPDIFYSIPIFTGEPANSRLLGNDYAELCTFP